MNIYLTFLVYFLDSHQRIIVQNKRKEERKASLINKLGNSLNNQSCQKDFQNNINYQLKKIVSLYIMKKLSQYHQQEYADPLNSYRQNIKNQTAQQQYQGNYLTNINQLITEPVSQNKYTTQYIMSSLYQLSSYLFMKKIQPDNIANSELQISFDSYLNPIKQQLSIYERGKKIKIEEEETFISDQQQSLSPQKCTSKKDRKSFNIESQLVKCYQKVPYVFFQQNFFINFSTFEDKQNPLKYNNTDVMALQQEKMNDNLDLVEINLFGQIHKKFHDYFKVAANFDYLRESIQIQLAKLKESRRRIKKVKAEFVDKSVKLRHKILHKSNLQKLIKKAKILKSLQKLPIIIQSILKSSLPYECLQLLQSTKSSINQVEKAKSISNIILNIRQCQTIAQLGLNKRYSDQIYLYLQEVGSKIIIQDQWKKIKLNCPNILQKDTTANFSRSLRPHQNDSFNYGQRSGFFILDQISPQQGSNSQLNTFKNLLTNKFAKRSEAKQYQISMIVLQSYEFISFPVDTTKIKICNYLRVISKKFQKDLLQKLSVQLSKQKERKIIQSLIEKDMSESVQQGVQKNYPNQNTQIKSVVDQISIEYYVRHIKVLNQFFKQMLNRFLGYLFTLLTEYEEILSKKLKNIRLASQKSISSKKSVQLNQTQKHGNNQQSKELKLQKKATSIYESNEKVKKSHNNFKSIFEQEISLLPSIFKVIQEKIKYFLTLKNISSVSPRQFYQWISILKFWQRWFDLLVQQSTLVNYNFTSLKSQVQIEEDNQMVQFGRGLMQELLDLIHQNIRKSLNTISIKNMITQLSVNYLTSYHQNIIRAELSNQIMEQSWQSIQIPPQFSDVLNGILCKPGQNNNISLTILNTSNQNNSKLSAAQQQLSQSASTFKYKILKNNILIEGQRYKVTISFVLLCEFIQQYLRISRLFSSIVSDTRLESNQKSAQQKKIFGFVYQKIYDLIQFYNLTCKQMILQKKALKMEKIKGNNITVRHICLVSNCLTLLQKIIHQIPLSQLKNVVSKHQKQQSVILGLRNHNNLLFDKISTILLKKIQGFVNSLMQNQKNASLIAFVTQCNQQIVTVFLQITQIIDQYLDIQKCQNVLKEPLLLFVQKYFKNLIMRGSKFKTESALLVQRLKFLKKYFKNQFIAMERQVLE